MRFLLLLPGFPVLGLAAWLENRQAGPTPEQICGPYGKSFEVCRKDFDGCVSEKGASPQDRKWDAVLGCMASRRNPGPGSRSPSGYRGLFRDRAPAAASGQVWDDKSQISPHFRADIRVDTNRDGVVDVQGATDIHGKDTWSQDRGAIFLANIGDSGRRCAMSAVGRDPNAPLEVLAKCHDAADDVQRAPRYMAPIRTVPIAGLSSAAWASVVVSDPQARSQVRIFRELPGNKWEIVYNTRRFSADEVGKGLVLGIDARDVRRPGGWDGRVKVAFTVNDQGRSSTDAVMLRVAPVLLQHHTQAVQSVFAATMNYDNVANAELFRQFVRNMASAIQIVMRKAGIAEPLRRLVTDDPWAQDHFESAYTSMPGPKGPVTLRILIEGRQRKTSAVRVIYDQLRGDGIGCLRAFRPASEPDDTYQAGGNSEAIPPYELNGKKFPAGRIVQGGDPNTVAPLNRAFYQAQELQAPLLLDTSWLGVRHIDEVIQFVPAKTRRGWGVLVVDPQLGIDILRLAQAHGAGNVKVINPATTRESSQIPTIDEFLKSPTNMEAAEKSKSKMQGIIDALKRETGITDSEIFSVPILFGLQAEVLRLIAPSGFNPKKRDLGHGTAKKEELAFMGEKLIEEHVPSADTFNGSLARNERRQTYLPGALHAYHASLVNGVPFSERQYLAPKPWGPLINGQDLFEVVANRAYTKAGFSAVDYVDDWTFHARRGDLHCLTNTFRDNSAPWWKA